MVALTGDGELRRHVGSPDAGFIEHEKLATRISATSALAPTFGCPLVAAGETDLGVVLRRGEVLCHALSSSESRRFQPPQRVRAEVWVADAQTEVHRG